MHQACVTRRKPILGGLGTRLPLPRQYTPALPTTPHPCGKYGRRS